MERKGMLETSVYKRIGRILTTEVPLSVHGWMCIAIFLGVSTIANGSDDNREDLPESVSSDWQFEITSPTKGDRWASDSQHWVTWTTIGSSTKDYRITLEVSFDDGIKWSPIMDSDGRLSNDLPSITGETSRFLWRIPGNQLDDGVQLRIVSPKECGNVDVSEPFSIIPSQEEEYIWELVTKSPGFEPRDGAGALVYENAMWLLGGWNAYDPENFPRTTTSEIWMSTDGAHWKLGTGSVGSSS